ncbi:MAG: type II/IV secretion system protein [Candidatus Liptonbacteria bacterium]|nr:type II/IV secretion system protein [Candidatus Liptonbacteria bacterium]
MTGDQLLKELQRAGVLDAVSATKVQREALLGNRSVEDVLYTKRLADDQRVAEVKSAALKIPYQKVDIGSFDDSLLRVVPEATARTYGVAPLGRKEGLLVVGMLNPDDQKAQEALKFVARSNRASLGIYVISWGDWQRILQKYSPYRNDIDEALASFRARPGTAKGKNAVRLEEVKAGDIEDAPVIKIVARTFEEAVLQRASDVHIEPQESFLRVRFRINGELQESASLPLELAQPVISRIKVLSNLKIDENRVPQDGRFRTTVQNREIDFRVATFPTPAGEKIAVRVLDPSVGLKSFDMLGLTGRNLAVLEKNLAKPYGMVVVSGPTGSGKTTTLYAVLQRLNSDKVNIVSLEDPVEYLVSGVNQSQVHPEIGYDFASGLRQILRQDPDVIMVGEIRDAETAELAVRAALTGHIVLSTIHTNNAASVVSRLMDMKVEPFLLPVSVSVMIAQRLVGELCAACKAREPASPGVLKIIAAALQGLPEEVKSRYAEPYKIFHAPGCSACKGRGITGRIALFEILEMSDALKEIVATGPTIQRIVKEAKDQGMITLRQDGVMKALEGTVMFEEVVRETEEV